MFRVGVTRESQDLGELGLSLLDAAAGVEWEFLPAAPDELTAELLAPYEAIICSRARITRASLEGVQRLALVARLGVGFDRVDVEALTDHGALLTTAPDGVRRPLASAAAMLVLALAHRLPDKARRGRDGVWGGARVGTGLTGRTLGVVGLGNIGRELVHLLRPWELRFLAHDPYAPPHEGVELVELDRLLRESDFVVVACPLNDETRGLLSRERLGLLRPEAYLVNIARGPIVDQAALTDALREGLLAGAALDVFEQEPYDPDDPILRLDNVIATPHTIGHTDEAMLGVGRSACRAALAVAAGEVPSYVVNREALAHPRLARLR